MTTTLGIDALPLSGVRVVEFCTTASGPYACMLLGDMGADVLKIEPPGGDSFRQWPPLSGGFSENFASVNRNKRSAALNLKASEDAAIARQIILDADVVVENNRPGVMSRLGLGYAELSREKSSLVYCSISAYGQSGPRSAEGGFDLTMQAAAGVMSVTGESGGPPAKCGVPLVDFSAGLYAAYSIAAALLQVRASGKGVHIDVPMFGCTLGVAALQTSEYFGSGRNPQKLGSAHPRNAPYQAFRAEDDYFAIAAGNDRLWRKVLDVVGRPDLADDDRFVSTARRAHNQAQLKDILESIFTTRPADVWMHAFDDAGVPYARINTYEAALADAQTVHMGWVQPLTLPNGHVTRTFASPVQFNGKRFPIRMPPPELGTHTEAIRRKYSRKEQK